LIIRLLCKMECTSNHELVANIKYASGSAALLSFGTSEDGRLKHKIMKKLGE